MKDIISLAKMSEISPIIEEILRNGSDVRLTVTGDSMYPMLRNCQDSVILTKAEPNKIKKYSIPLYRRDSGQYVLHRIIKIKNNELYINGDNQVFIEHPVYKNQIIAIVKGFYRGGRYFSCKNPFYIFYQFVWVIGFPFRKQLMKIYLYVTKIISGLRRKVSS